MAIGLTVPVLTLMGGGTAVANAAASGAAQQDFDVWLRAGNKVHVKSGSCRDLTFTMRHNAGLLESCDAAVEVWRGPNYLGQTYDHQYDSRGPLRASYYWCPFEGLGKLRLGPTEVDGTDNDWHSSRGFWDDSRAAMTVKQHQTCRVDWARKARGRVKVSLDGPAIRKKARYRVVQSGTKRTWSCAQQFRR